MANLRLLRIPIRCIGNAAKGKSPITSSGTSSKTYHHDEKISTFKMERGIDLAKSVAVEEAPCLFYSLRQLGVSTSDRTHTLNASCDTIVRLIKMGFVNKNLAIQYCHYINELGRTSDEKDLKYYQERSLDLMFYLLRNGRELTATSIYHLITDVADVCQKNCNTVIEKALDDYKLLDNIDSRSFSKLLASCYKFGLWDQANSLMAKNLSACDFSLYIIDPMVQGMKKTASILEESSSGLSETQRVKIEDAILEHLFMFIEGGFKVRTQFITKYTDELSKALSSLRVKVVKNPVIKLSGRCTNCDAHLPLYDQRCLSDLNSSIKDVLLQSITKNQEKLYLNSTDGEVEKFDQFLLKLTHDSARPIDCVIDGLNVAYRNTEGIFYIQQAISNDFSRSVKRQNTEALGRILINTILRSEFLKNFRKLLVIGRDHMRYWPGLIDFFEKHKIHYYFSSSQSKDDLFSLYAATLHPKTILLSSDFFRDHLAQLQTDKRILLERWLDTHQSWVYYKNLTAITPTPYEKIPSLDRKSGHFHIPVIDYHKLEKIANHEPPPHLNKKMITWLCCKRELDVE